MQLRGAVRMRPATVIAKLAQRVGLGGLATVRRALVFSQADPLHALRFADNLKRLEAAATATGRWSPPDYDGASVLEIGCGPLIGFAPAVAARGARGYFGVDPAADPGVVATPRFMIRYLLPAFDVLRDAGVAAVSRERYAEVFDGGVSVHAGELAGAAPPELLTLVLSLSCLEHIDDLATSLAALRGCTGRGTRQLHLVNFSNHRDKSRPFATIYEMPPETYTERYGSHINLLRSTDVMDRFHAAGLDAGFVVLDDDPKWLARTPVHSWWKGRYDPEVLGIRTGLFFL